MSDKIGMKRTVITYSSSAWLFRRGDRVEVSGRIAVVKAVAGCTATIAWRDAWYWRALWRVERVLRRTVSALRARITLPGARQ